MSERPPQKLSGSNDLAVWLNQLREFAISSRLISAYNAMIEGGTDGIRLKAIPGSGGTSTPGPVRATLFLILGDHLVCKLFGTSTQVKVAKNPKLRLSLTTETIEGITYTYSSGVYTATGVYYRRDAQPTSPAVGEVEKQTVNPDYIVGEEIWIDPITAFTTSDPTPVSVTYIEHFARLWLRRDDQGT